MNDARIEQLEEVIRRLTDRVKQLESWVACRKVNSRSPYQPRSLPWRPACKEVRSPYQPRSLAKRKGICCE